MNNIASFLEKRAIRASRRKKGGHIGWEHPGSVRLLAVNQPHNKDMVEHLDHYAVDGSPVSFVFHPWQRLLVILTSWVDEQWQQVTEYLRTENRVLNEKLRKRRIFFSHDQRRQRRLESSMMAFASQGRGHDLFWRVFTIRQEFVEPSAVLPADDLALERG